MVSLMAKRELLKLPGTFEQALGDLLQTPPAPKDKKPETTRKKKGARKKGR
jgi:hypothetical protein